MIAFLCSHCHKALKVKDELAGKKCKCPQCGKPILVPLVSEQLVGTGAEAAKRRPVPEANKERTLPPQGPPPAAQPEDGPTLPPGNVAGPAAQEGSSAHDTQACVPQSGPPLELTDFLAPPQAADEIGRLGLYRILNVLGTGGMGVVYLAEDTRLKRKVALKAMLPTLAASESACKRFLREAQTAAAIEHDHIVPIFQVGEDRGVPFIAMPFLKGQSLDERLKKEPRLPLAEVLRIGKETARGLAAAHAEGLIHRDIKPANLWLEGKDSRVKILDFGLARALVDQTQLTQQGAIVGTPAYMAPEQAMGQAVDQRCDLFSLGCVLYRLCTGEVPFKGNDTLAILSALALESPRAPAAINPAVPGALSDLVLRLLAKKPADRPASAQVVADALQEIADDRTAEIKGGPGKGLPPERVGSAQKKAGPEPAVPSRPTAPRRRVAVLGAVGLLALIGAGILFGGQIIRVVTNQGELVIEVDDPTVEVKIVQNGVVVQDKTSKREFTLTAGKGAIEVLEKDGIKLATRQFELTRGGKTTVKVTLQELAGARKPKGPGPAVKKEPPAIPASTDPDRRAAEWVLSIRGGISIKENGKEREIKAVGDLPQGAFELTGVGLQSNAKVSDAGLAHFKDCKDLGILVLRFTRVSDAGLAHFKDCKKLTDLRLEYTQVSDAGLAYFKDCKDLTNLDLNRTQVSDAGLAHFKDCKDLTTLQLEWDAQVSDAGLAYFKDCKKLTGLNLSGTQVSDAGLAYFKDCKDLTNLNLNRTQVSDAGLSDLASLPRLTQLSLISTRISLRGQEQLKAAMPKCNITWSEPNRSVAESVLALGGTIEIGTPGQPESRPVKAAADLPRDYFQVRRVSLADVAKPLDKLRKELSGLRFPDFDRLESIDLSGITGLNYDFLVPIPGLRELSLANTGLNDAALAKLPKLPALKRLVLDGNDIHAQGLAHLSGRPELIDLSLGCPSLTDLFAKNVAELKQVKRLSLAGSGLTDAGIKHLAGLTNLEWLDLRRTKASAASVADLQKALPKCQIEWDGKKDK